ncbi:MAG: hypothetical protein E6K99_08260 [Thaumarchaeota archaeon]|nr:MAG: hypothetical protein E6K99_08260 [Nitrososphaerota archaeon]
MTTGPRFTLHQAFIRGDGRYYLPLPKLNRVQRDTIAARLTRIGFRVGGGERLKAYSSAGFIHINGSGLATSNMDLFDPLVPLIPELLRVKREEVALDELASMYFAAKRRGGTLHLRLSVRAESLGLWRKLRAAGESLLTPDEASVLKLLLRDARGRVEAVTDYPTEGSRVRQIGGRLYYLSAIEPEEFASNLRTVEGPRRRNAYMPSSATLSLGRPRPPTRSELMRLLSSLDEWCYFTPL